MPQASESVTEHPSEKSAPAVGARAPDFTLVDQDGKPHTLSGELRAGKPLVLFFMRGEW